MPSNDARPVLQDHASVRFPPLAIFLLTMVFGYALDRWVWSLHLLNALPAMAVVAIGIGLVVAGFALILQCVGLFRGTGQKPKPWTPTPVVITTGVYRYSRNPMYLGMAGTQLGFGLALRSDFIVLLVPVALWFVYLIAVRHEETYLTVKFGATYTAYRQTVRRWL